MGEGFAGEGDSGPAAAPDGPVEGAEADQEGEEAPGEEEPELDEGEAMMAREVAEAAGQSFHAGLRALRRCGGRADRAVTELLGLEAEAESEAEGEAGPEAPPSGGIAETMGSSLFQPAEDTFAGVEATDVDGDALLSEEAALYGPPPAKRRRAEGGESDDPVDG
uniref:Uncharacterized protein n=1 Tax=Alexandrium catenella TaxID=2925 RepID=A0A7S1WSF7_ALECA